MANLSDFIYGYGEFNSLAFEVFCLLKNHGTLSLQLKAQQQVYFRLIADFQEPTSI